MLSCLLWFCLKQPCHPPPSASSCFHLFTLHLIKLCASQDVFVQWVDSAGTPISHSCLSLLDCSHVTPEAPWGHGIFSVYVCVCEKTFGYDCICIQQTCNSKFLYLGSVHVVCWEGCVTPGCDPQLQFSGSQEESPCAVSPILSHTLTHAPQSECLCVLSNLPLL